MKILAPEEKQRSRSEGAEARKRGAGTFENPYWQNWPRPAPGGELEEDMARHWVDGYLQR